MPQSGMDWESFRLSLQLAGMTLLILVPIAVLMRKPPSALSDTGDALWYTMLIRVGSPSGRTTKSYFMPASLM